MLKVTVFLSRQEKFSQTLYPNLCHVMLVTR